jgi:hypothetical protein
MSNIDNGGPAFPLNHEIPHPKGLRYDVHWDGMTLRDWFAGQALPAVIAYALENPSRIAADETGNVGPEVCRLAYETADGMIKARKVQP